jgi:hypothetical protein
MFPTCSEILEVIQALGYRKVAQAAASPLALNTAPIAMTTATENVSFCCAPSSAQTAST